MYVSDIYIYILYVVAFCKMSVYVDISLKPDQRLSRRRCSRHISSIFRTRRRKVQYLVHLWENIARPIVLSTRTLFPGPVVSLGWALCRCLPRVGLPVFTVSGGLPVLRTNTVCVTGAVLDMHSEGICWRSECHCLLHGRKGVTASVKHASRCCSSSAS